MHIILSACLTNCNRQNEHGIFVRILLFYLSMEGPHRNLSDESIRQEVTLNLEQP